MSRYSASHRTCCTMMLVLLSGCGTDPTGVTQDSNGSTALAVHPSGGIVATTPLASRPFGAAISSSTGVVLVTQLDAFLVSKGKLPATTLPTPIAVGFIPTNVKFDNTGATAFVTNQFDNTVGFIKVSTNTQVATVVVPMSTFNLAYCKSNRRLYVTGPGTSVYVISVENRGIVDSIPTAAVTNGIVSNATCSRIYVSDESNGRVLEINPATDQVIRTFPTGGAPKDLGVTPNGKRLYVADETGAVQAWVLATGQLLTSVPLPAGAFGLAIAPDGRQVYAGMPFGGAVVVISTETNTIVNTIATGGMPRKIAFDGTGKIAVIANEAGWVDYIN